MRKLTTTKIEYPFEEQEEPIEFNVDMKIKTRSKPKHIIILEHKKKKKVIDASTKLF